MTAVAEAIRRPLTPTPESARRPLAFVVSASTVDITAHPKGPLPTTLQEKPPGPKETVTDTTFWSIINDLRDTDTTFTETSGGNGTNIAPRLAKLRRHDDGDIILHTWAPNDPHGRLIRNDLDSFRGDGLKPDVVEIADGETSLGLVIPRETPKGPDRLIYSYKSPELPSDFISALKENHPKFAVINSLGGPDWDKSLVDGTNYLKEKNIPYIYTPGSSQLEAVKNGTHTDQIKAVYSATHGAYALSVNVEELTDLVKGNNKEPVENITGLLKQGKELVGTSGRLFVTDGPNGAYGVDTDGSIRWIAPTKEISVVNTNGAGDAFIAAAALRTIETEGDIDEGLLWGSTSASFAVEQEGAHANPPTRYDIQQRLNNKKHRPGLLHVVESLHDIPKEELQNAMPTYEPRQHMLYAA